MKFDYIVVGAGSAGAVLANRLTADGKSSVLLLEAGGSDKRFWVQVPIGYGKVYYDDAVNWKYTTEPDPNRAGLRSYWPRGKVMGGSSSINAMVYVRGHPLDYAEWGDAAKGWGWDDVAPVFKRMEDWVGGEDDFRGAGGPVAVNDIHDQAHPLTHRFLKAANQAGIPTNPDYNGKDMEGATCYQITTKAGRRMSSARAYIDPIRKRSNLCIETKAQVTRVLFDGKRAIGVEYVQHGQTKTAHAIGEVILCGGAINTPQLLQLSGVGPRSILGPLGIELVQDAPMVGRNLSDHLGGDNLFRSNVPSLNNDLRPVLGKLKAGIQYFLTGKGPLSLSLNQGGGFIRVMDGATRPDLQLYFSPVSYTRAPVGTRPLMNPDPFAGFLMGYNPCKPTSQGHLQIRSNDPFEHPEMHSNYLDTEYDRAVMIAGVRMMRILAQMPALSEVIETEIYPGIDIQTDDEILEFLREKAWTVFHQCSTCRMNDDPNLGVVDGQLRVHGVSGLRVADASIFPTIPSGNTNAPAMMVGEMASDIIIKDRRKTVA